MCIFAIDMKCMANCLMRERHTFGIDVKADLLVEFDSEEELRTVLRNLKGPVLTMGAGSNLLFLADYHGTILHSKIDGIELVGEDDASVTLKVGSGVVWDEFTAFCVEHGWWGVENLTAIPGEVGASAVQNIGAYGAEAADTIVKVRTLSMADGTVRTFDASECGYGYRSSVFKHELKGQYVVTYVFFKLYKTDNPNIGYGSLKQTVEELGAPTLTNVRRAVQTIRSSKLPDPKVLGNAGSFFMNPVISVEKFRQIQSEYPDIPSYPAGDGMCKVPAGWLIERCGWKGRSQGAAAVHSRQALVLVNNGGATGQEIKNLADAVTSDVRNRFGITLSTEVNYIT